MTKTTFTIQKSFRRVYISLVIADCRITEIVTEKCIHDSKVLEKSLRRGIISAFENVVEIHKILKHPKIIFNEKPHGYYEGIKKDMKLVFTHVFSCFKL